MTLQETSAGLRALSMPPDPEHSADVIRASLAMLRRHLGMEVGFVSRIEAGERAFVVVDADTDDVPVEVDASDPVDETYCGRVVAGLLPELVTDAAAEPAVADLEVTRALGIGAHLSVPLRRTDGRVIGTLCCFSRVPDTSLRDRDLGLMRLFADLVGLHLETMLGHQGHRESVRRRVLDVLDAGGPVIAVQPIVELTSGDAIGFEALSRFGTSSAAGGEWWSPDRWFSEAARAGVGAELEMSAVANAVALVQQIPDGLSLAVNVSGEALSHPPLVELLTAAPAGRLVVELTEHRPVGSYLALAEPLRRIREAGARVAIDDAGSGYAGLAHIVALRPEVVKLDRSMVDGLVEDPARQAMVSAMVGFAERMGSALVAEGVEHLHESSALADLGVRLGQGYLFGRPDTTLPWAV
jgi:EAL domain-containing protein (putative c-di-GMP-specific phosphodiesterase class I)